MEVFLGGLFYLQYLCVNKIIGIMAYGLSISKKVNITGRSELQLRLRLGKVDQQASTHLFVNPQHVRWEHYLSSKGRKSKRLVLSIARLKTPEVQHTAEIKESLERMIAHIDNCILVDGIENITKGWLSKKIDEFTMGQAVANTGAVKKGSGPRKPKSPSFFEAYNTFVESRELSIGRRRHFNVIGRVLQRYELYRQLLQPKFKLTLDGMDDAMLHDLEDYIKNEHQLLKMFPQIIQAVPESRTPAERGQNTVNGYFKKIKTFFFWAIKKNLTTNDPFKEYKISQDVYGTPYYITIEERHQIEQTDLSHRPALAVQRDIFVFHCCVGCRVSDLKRMTKDNFINGEIHYIARKTQTGHPVTLKIPLNETALNIIERYADPNRKSLLPFISDQKYNEAIKEIFTIAGVTRNVVVRNSLTGEEEIRPINEVASSHMARRTFTGIIYSVFKDQALVSELTGHAPGSRAFARYREIDHKMKQEMVDVIK